VFVSSHLLSEMALTAQELIVIGRGKLIAQSSTEEFIARSTGNTVLVRGTGLSALRAALTHNGISVRGEDGALVVSGMDIADIGELAAANGAVLHELSPRHGSLEDAFIQLTGHSVDYHADLDLFTAGK
jgi:ABC-2 type transport system ATP-binding protein